MDPARRGGVLLRIEGQLFFVPSSIAVRVAPPPRVTPVPGGPAELLGIALHEGTILPVLSVGTRRGDMLVCQHAGELLGLVGGEVVHSGAFNPAAEKPHMVEHQGQLARPLDVAAIYARVQAGTRPGRWGT